MTKRKTIIAGAIILCSVAGCATSALPRYNRGNYVYSSHSNLYYLHAKEVPPLTIPAGLTGTYIDDFYTIPPAPPSSSKPVSLIPPGSLAEATANHRL